ncbi:MAG: FAD-dependent oxidoreductase [Chloroflexi bacterium]|nr:FAD-dependent oxidoreductase [Chloroflexota bacterium]
MTALARPGLFSPLRVGTLTLQNRLAFAPIGLSLLSRQQYLDFLAARAKGGAGLVMVAAGMVMRDVPADFIRLHADEFVPELRQISAAVHAHGAKVGIQVLHQGRQSPFPDEPVAPSPIPCPVTRRMPRELAAAEIEALVEDYAEGVRRARDAGFDLAEIHAAHGYLVSQFLSARSNQRADGYGGDLRGRSRFLTDILRRARQKVGRAFPISCRINGNDNIDGGLLPEETEAIAALAEEAGADLINVSGGVYGSYPVTIAPFYAAPALYVDVAARVKRRVRIPVGVACRIESVDLAERTVQEGKADLVALGRPLIADPDLPLKASRGDRDSIRPCIYCNQGCMKELDKVEPITCTVNPQVGREGMSVAPPQRKKRVLVIGGGLAGLEAAYSAARRGHTVTLYEEARELGGQWHLAAAPPLKQGYLRFLRWLTRQVEQHGVQVRLGAHATQETVANERPDAIVVATGAKPMIPPIPGIERAVTAWDVLWGQTPIGERVVIIGGNSVGLETAHSLAVAGKKVLVLEMQQYIGADMPSTVRWHLRRLLDQRGVQSMRSAKVKAIHSDGIVVETKEGEKALPAADTVVLAVGSHASREFAASLQGLAPEVYVVGDATRPRSALEAVREGWDVGCAI